MEFKAGDRVRVLRLNGKKVNFFTTLKCTTLPAYYQTTDSSDSNYDGYNLRNPWNYYFGIDRYDYYTLATDEEDTEEPVIQRTTDTHDPVNKPSHYMLGDIEVKDIIAIVADKYHKGSVAHNVASALEYQMRAPGKNGLEDIKKARKCLDFAIENWE